MVIPILQKEKLRLKVIRVTKLGNGNWNIVLSHSPGYLSLSFLLNWDNKGSNLAEKGQKGSKKFKHLKIDQKDILCPLSRN